MCKDIFRKLGFKGVDEYNMNMEQLPLAVWTPPDPGGCYWVGTQSSSLTVQKSIQELSRRVNELEDFVLNLESKYIAKERGITLEELVEDVHCLTTFIQRLRECFGSR